MAKKEKKETTSINNTWEKVYVLFFDVVGFSLEDDTRQKDIVQTIKVFTESAKTLKSFPRKHIQSTGDGILLITPSDRNEETPFGLLDVACEAQRFFRRKNIYVRIGLNCGNAFRIENIGEGSNYAGTVINEAQRVMNLGDANHILLHENFYAEILGIRRKDTRTQCEGLGSAIVKHGQTIEVYNFVRGNAGNRRKPERADRKLIVENLLYDHLNVVLREIEGSLSKRLNVSQKQSQLRTSILLLSHRDKEFFVSPYRYHYRYGQYGHVRSKTTFPTENNNPVWLTYKEGVSRFFKPKYEFHRNQNLYIQDWMKSYPGLSRNNIKAFERKANCYLYSPIMLVDPGNRSRKQKFGVLCTDMMCVLDNEILRKILFDIEKAQMIPIASLLAALI